MQIQSPATSDGVRWDYLVLQTVPWVAAASSVHGLQIGPLRQTGLFWMATLLLCVLRLPLKGTRQIAFPWLCWLPLYALLFASLFWGDFSFKYNLQLAVQMTVYPLVGLLASYAVESSADVLRWNRTYLVVTLLIGLACLYYMHGPGQALQSNEKDLYVGFAPRPAATTLIVVGALFLAQFRKFPLVATTLWIGCLGVGILTGSRMVTVILLLQWLVHPRLTSVGARVGATFLMMAVGLAAFNTPIIQDRFFEKSSGFSGKGSVEDVLQGKFDSAGRFDSWPKILERSQDRPWLGHGVGQSAPFVYRIWAPMDKPHNEYLKMLYEVGYTGLAFFILGLLGTLFNLARLIRRTEGDAQTVAVAAYMGWIGFILLSVVDNPLVYGNNFLQPLFVLVGAANGLARQQAGSFSSAPRPRDVSIRPIADRALPALIPLR